MVISRTPLRVSFVGGGSDLKEYYSKTPGAVVSTAIDKYLYVMVNTRPDNLIRLAYSKAEYVNDVSKLEHNIIRESLKLLGIKNGIDVTYSGDLPIDRVGTGLGASSSLSVGVLNALYFFKGEKVTPEQLAREACKIEIEILGHPIGKQDQYIAAYGGINHIRFYPDESVEVKPISIPEEAKKVFEKNLLLFHTGFTSDSITVLTEQKEKTPVNGAILANMVSFTDLVSNMLTSGKLDQFGDILHKNWIYKKKLASKISNNIIDESYEKGISAGAEGGKILGSGGGGFLLFYCPSHKQASLRQALSHLEELEFNFATEGSKIIYSS